MIERYISTVQELRDQLSISMQWSQVSAPLLESLEMDRLRFPEIYDERAARYRLEPYRLKLSYTLERLRLTHRRNQQLAEAGWEALRCQLLSAGPHDRHRADGQRSARPPLRLRG